MQRSRRCVRRDGSARSLRRRAPSRSGTACTCRTIRARRTASRTAPARRDRRCRRMRRCRRARAWRSAPRTLRSRAAYPRATAADMRRAVRRSEPRATVFRNGCRRRIPAARSHSSHRTAIRRCRRLRCCRRVETASCRATARFRALHKRSPPRLRMVVTAASVSTLWISVGLPNNPLIAGTGGLNRTRPRFPSRLSSSDVSSPHMYAPAPIRNSMSNAPTRAARVATEHARAASRGQRARQYVARTRILRTQVHVALRRARRDRGDQHAFDQLKRIRFDQQPVRKRSGIALVRVAHDVLHRIFRVENGLPLHCGRECRTAAAAQSGGAYLIHDLCRRKRPRARQPLEPTVGAIGIEIERIDHAGACERQARLALQERHIVDEADARRVAPVRHARPANSSATCLGITRGNPMRPSAVSTSTNGSSAYAPREPLRTTRASMPLAVSAASTATATASAPNEHALVSFGTKTRDGHGRRRPIVDERGDERVESFGRDPAVNRIVDAHGRPARAIAEAICRFQRHPPVGRSRSHRRAEAAFGMRLRARGNPPPDTLLPDRSVPR